MDTFVEGTELNSNLASEEGNKYMEALMAAETHHAFT